MFFMVCGNLIKVEVYNENDPRRFLGERRQFGVSLRHVLSASISGPSPSGWSIGRQALSLDHQQFGGSISGRVAGSFAMSPGKICEN